MSLTDSEVTALLDAWSDGEPDALSELMPVVYDELRRMAESQFRREGQNHTLQPTAVVNEVFLRLKGQRRVHWRSRAEFFAVAARLIRRVLVDHARHRKRIKRGGNVPRVPLDEMLDRAEARAPDLIALDDALEALGDFSPRQSRVVELRIFGGLTLEEISRVLEMSRSTVHREWNAALLWLRRELSPA
ncbi:MAG: sigma-70 family RNA polymerase sigma factor [Acidobacteriota bacterium]